MSSARDDSSQAIVFLVDNSATSIDGDFFPSRLEAQKIAISRIVRHFERARRKIQFALGALAMPNTGIVASLSDSRTILRYLDKLTPGEGLANVDKGIRCAMLSLHQCDSDSARPAKRIIVMIGSETTPEWSERLCDDLCEHLRRESVSLDIVAFGSDVSTVELQYIVAQAQGGDPKGPQSHYVECPAGGALLSDMILDSPIGNSVYTEPVLDDNDPDLQETIRLSMLEPDAQDPELEEALRLSRLEAEQAALREALELSRQEDVENDEAIKAAWADGEEQKEQKDKENEKKDESDKQ